MSRDALKERIVSATIKQVSSGGAVFLEDRPCRGFISTRDVNLDYNIGRPGIPLGRVTEITGTSGSGKSMLCCHLIGECQKAGGVALLLDTERSYDPGWATKMGVDAVNLIDPVEYLVDQNDMGVLTLEDSLMFIEDTLDSIDDDQEIPVIIVVDSLSALPTRADMDSDYTQGQPARHAAIMSMAMRKLPEKVFNKKVALVIVGQLRDTIMQFGAPDTTIGGKAVGYHAALQIKMRRTGFVEEKHKTVGFKTEAKITKNKLGGIPFVKVPLTFYLDRGIDPVMSTFELALDMGLIKQAKKGWYQFAEGSKNFRDSSWPIVATAEVLDNLRRLAFPEEGSVEGAGV
jgi:recombination protein RecA